METLTEKLQRLEGLSDLRLVSADGVVFHVHKVCLAGSSLFFRDMFCAGTSPNEMLQLHAEFGQTELQLRELKGCELEVFLGRIYMTDSAGEFFHPITLDNVKILTEAARKYQVPSLLAFSDNFCVEAAEVNSGSVIDWLKFAYDYDLPKFSLKCEEVVKRGDLQQMIGHLPEIDLEELPSRLAAKLLIRAAKSEAGACWRVCKDLQGVQVFGAFEVLVRSAPQT